MNDMKISKLTCSCMSNSLDFRSSSMLKQFARVLDWLSLSCRLNKKKLSSSHFIFWTSHMKRNSTPPLMAPPTINNNSGMPFSVSDILQPFDMDTSTSYRRSIEMAHTLNAASSSSSSSSAYSSQRPSSSATPANLCNPVFAPSNISTHYYGPSSTTAATTTATTPFSPNHQYYDYASSFPNGSAMNAVNGQYPSNSCWYGPAASMFMFRMQSDRKSIDIAFSVTIFSWLLIVLIVISCCGRRCCCRCCSRQCRFCCQCLWTSSRFNDEISLCTISVRFTET
jgi:hypothetical protein